MEEKEEIDRLSHLASSRGLGWRQDGLSTLTDCPGTRHPSERGLDGSRGRQVGNYHLCRGASKCAKHAYMVCHNTNTLPSRSRDVCLRLVSAFGTCDMTCRTGVALECISMDEYDHQGQPIASVY